MYINFLPKNPNINDISIIRGIEFIWDGYDWLYKETLSGLPQVTLDILEENKEKITEQIILVDILKSSLLADYNIVVTALQLLDALSTSKLSLKQHDEKELRPTALAFLTEKEKLRKLKKLT